MRRAAEFYAGAAKTDPRDAWVLADLARRHVDQLVWLDVSDELLGKLRILNGRDVDGRGRQPGHQPLSGCAGKHFPSS